MTSVPFVFLFLITQTNFQSFDWAHVIKLYITCGSMDSLHSLKYTCQVMCGGNIFQRALWWLWFFSVTFVHEIMSYFTLSTCSCTHTSVDVALKTTWKPHEMSLYMQRLGGVKQFAVPLCLVFFNCIIACNTDGRYFDDTFMVIQYNFSFQW